MLLAVAFPFLRNCARESTRRFSAGLPPLGGLGGLLFPWFPRLTFTPTRVSIAVLRAFMGFVLKFVPGFFRYLLLSGPFSG